MVRSQVSKSNRPVLIDEPIVNDDDYLRMLRDNTLDEPPRNTYSIISTALPLILPISCMLVWEHISDIALEVVLCPAVVVLIVWPYNMRFWALGMVKDNVYALKPRDVNAMKARISPAIQITTQYVREVASSATNYAEPNMPWRERL